MRGGPLRARPPRGGSANGARLNQPIVLTFSAPIDPGSVRAETVRVVRARDGGAVAGRLAVRGGDRHLHAEGRLPARPLRRRLRARRALPRRGAGAAAARLCPLARRRPSRRGGRVRVHDRRGGARCEGGRALRRREPRRPAPLRTVGASRRRAHADPLQQAARSADDPRRELLVRGARGTSARSRGPTRSSGRSWSRTTPRP